MQYCLFVHCKFEEGNQTKLREAVVNNVFVKKSSKLQKFQKIPKTKKQSNKNAQNCGKSTNSQKTKSPGRTPPPKENPPPKGPQKTENDQIQLEPWF